MIKRRTNDDKRLKNLRPKKFTSEYQPTPEAKSIGHQKQRLRQQIKDDFFKEFARPIINKATKEEIDTLSQCAQIIKHSLFSSKSKISEKDKAKLVIDLLGFMSPKENIGEFSGTIVVDTGIKYDSSDIIPKS